jgi:hypothetical protein
VRSAESRIQGVACRSGASGHGPGCDPDIGNRYDPLAVPLTWLHGGLSGEALPSVVSGGPAQESAETPQPKEIIADRELPSVGVDLDIDLGEPGAPQCRLNLRSAAQAVSQGTAESVGLAVSPQDSRTEATMASASAPWSSRRSVAGANAVAPRRAPGRRTRTITTP